MYHDDFYVKPSTNMKTRNGNTIYVGIKSNKKEKKKGRKEERKKERTGRKENLKLTSARLDLNFSNTA